MKLNFPNSNILHNFEEGLYGLVTFSNGTFLVKCHLRVNSFNKMCKNHNFLSLQGVNSKAYYLVCNKETQKNMEFLSNIHISILMIIGIAFENPHILYQIIIRILYL
jgi:hypothetical protein